MSFRFDFNVEEADEENNISSSSSSSSSCVARGNAEEREEAISDESVYVLMRLYLGTLSGFRAEENDDDEEGGERGRSSIFGGKRKRSGIMYAVRQASDAISSLGTPLGKRSADRLNAVSEEAWSPRTWTRCFAPFGDSKEDEIRSMSETLIAKRPDIFCRFTLPDLSKISSFSSSSSIVRTLACAAACRSLQCTRFALDRFNLSSSSLESANDLEGVLIDVLRSVDVGRIEGEDESTFRRRQQELGDVLQLLRDRGVVRRTERTSSHLCTASSSAAEALLGIVRSTRRNAVSITERAKHVQRLVCAIDTFLETTRDARDDDDDEDVSRSKKMSTVDLFDLTVARPSNARLDALLDRLSDRRRRDAIDTQELARISNERLSPEGGRMLDASRRRTYCQACGRVVGVETCRRCGVVAFCRDGSCRKREMRRHSLQCANILVGDSIGCLMRLLSDDDDGVLPDPHRTRSLLKTTCARFSRLDALLQSERSCFVRTVLQHLRRNLKIRPSSKKQKKKLPHERIVVHIIGAMREVDQPWTHLLELDDTTRFTLIFVGPEVLARKPWTEGPRLRFRCVRGLYHDCRDALETPQYSFVMNGGVHFYPSWAPTLRVLLVADAPPVIFTTWSLIEALETLRRVRSAASPPDRWVFRLATNPAGSKLPVVTPDNHGECNYSCRYVIRGKYVLR